MKVQFLKTNDGYISTLHIVRIRKGSANTAAAGRYIIEYGNSGQQLTTYADQADVNEILFGSPFLSAD